MLIFVITSTYSKMMIIPPHPHDEKQRLQELQELGILDTEAETLFDDIVKLGSHITGCPISLLSLIDTDRQWFKARVGIDAQESHRDLSFCGHAILHDDTFLVEDAREDARFSDNPFVIGEPNVRFYAGRPLVTKNGFRIGTLCTIDRVPRKLSEHTLELLDCLARQATFLIEQRRSQRTLEMTRRNSKTLFERTPLLIASMYGPHHIFEYVNTHDARLLGQQDAIGKTWDELHPEAIDPGFLDALDHVYQTGETRLVRDAMFRVGREMRHFDFVLTPRYGINMQIDGVMGIIDDITERRNMEIEVKRLSDKREIKFKKMAELLEKVPIYIALIEGPKHRFIFANRMYRDCFHLDESYEGKSVEELFPTAEYQGFIELLNKVYASGEAYVGRDVQFKQITPQGEEQEFFFNILYEVTKNKVGTITGILAATVDVTEQVLSRAEISSKVEALKSEQEIRERFVATLSHDLQNPLTAAKVGAERLRRKAYDVQTVHKLADRILGSIARTERMVRNLLDANRLKAGEGLPILRAPCCLNEVMAAAIEGTPSTGMHTLVHKAHSGVIEGLYDSEGLQRVIENLVSNAIKYGSIDAPITLSSRKGPNFVELSVHNDGPVITTEEQKTLFDTYRRLDAAIKSQQQGWGIGLALVKGIAQAHRGSVRVHSAEGAGTTFYVRLPWEPLPENAANDL